MLVSTNMKDERSKAPQKRPYRMRARAEAAAETGRRILEAVIELHRERFWDQVSLEDIAERAGVTVQTVIRRFGNKERLIDAAAEHHAEGGVDTDVLPVRVEESHADRRVLEGASEATLP